jgi:hypothetical protein
VKYHFKYEGDERDLVERASTLIKVDPSSPKTLYGNPGMGIFKSITGLGRSVMFSVVISEAYC